MLLRCRDFLPSATERNRLYDRPLVKGATYLFCLRAYPFVRSGHAHPFVPTLSASAARRARSVKDGASAPPDRGLSLTDRAPRYAGARSGGSVRLVSWCYVSYCVLRARHLAGLASRSMARAMVASAYIRQLRFGLPLCCMHGLIAQEGMGLIARTAEGLGPAAKRFLSHTSDLPDAPRGSVGTVYVQ